MVALVVFAGCGSDPVAPGGCPLGAKRRDNLCWAHLGLKSAWISAIAATPWGTFVGSEAGEMFRLEANGRWTALGPSVWRDRMVLRAIEFVPADPARLFVGLQFYNGPGDTARSALYASHDRGETWTPQDRDLYQRAPQYWQFHVFDIAVDPRDPQRLFVSSISGVLQSRDCGGTWRYVEGDFGWLTNGFVHLLIDPRNPDRMWVAGEGAIFNPFVGVSEDAGDTWVPVTPRCSGRVYETPVYSLALAPGKADRLFLGAQIGLFQSDEAGAPGSWECSGAVAGAVVGFGELGGDLYAATVFVDRIQEPDGDIREETELGLYRERDNGDSWTRLAVPRKAVGASAMAADPAAGRLLIGTRQGLWAVTPLPHSLQ